MDITFIKTFLELSKTRHFGRTAETLFITQSAVSARIRQLEEQLGVQLLTRDRNNIQLTAAGIRFQQHAESIVSIWNIARQETALKSEQKKLISVGGMFSLWDSILPAWLADIRLHMPDIAVRAEALDANSLLNNLHEGTLDLAFFFEPPRTSHTCSEECGELELVMVSNMKNLEAASALQTDDYILVDWGTEFLSTHARLFSDAAPAITHVNLGRLALDQITRFGGTAYLARDMASPFISSKQLFYVDDAPVIKRKFYVTQNINSQRKELIDSVLQSLKNLPTDD
ncbi:MAG: LysR family transcriptional regulator [Gammaproteobacteria bacterium]|nr:LysR family transcriptional regulator [Gammaproteobacteria bacterium]